jgi:hypothetical protein
MLADLIDNLRAAKTDKEKERAFRDLERVGMDRFTAAATAAEIERENKARAEATAKVEAELKQWR